MIWGSTERPLWALHLNALSASWTRDAAPRRPSQAQRVLACWERGTVEFIGGEFLYAVQVDTSQGFELCPADACQIGAAEIGGVCPAEAPAEKFRILRDFDHPLLPRWQAFLATNDIGIAGVEFITDEFGRAFTYDVNTNTNYNPEAEAKDGRRGMGAIAAYLGSLLQQRPTPADRSPDLAAAG